MPSTRSKPIRLTRGSVIVLEGLDKTGKTTQRELLKAKVSPEETLVTHMPSGLTDFTRDLYQILETQKPKSGLGRQLAHLTSHSENMTALLAATRSGALVLDRWWWSTMAYGWYGGDIPASGLSKTSFRELIDCVWKPITASAIFLLLTPRDEDLNNVAGVAEGYRELAAEHTGTVITVPPLSKEETHEFIISALADADLIQESEQDAGAM
ncbi:dTMP kinase [Brevibacterium casei]|uniref:Thymidylate kinase n=1 Tax=Brevibacterium casei TaxID=33889 RepID=A0A7T2WNH3_9MICO|nr:hypothetical protein [Brevibacterium casei]QPS33657.1 hypothetical protein I6G59_17345 [Brevibacterium casei]